MRLITFEMNGEARLGAWVYDDADVVDLAAAAEQLDGKSDPAYQSMQALIEAGPAALEKARMLVESASGAPRFATSECRILAPLPRPAQLRDFLSFPAHVLGCRVTTAELAIAASEDPEGKRAQMEASGYFNVPPGYYDHPVYYTSNRMAVFGPDDDILWPSFSTFIDYELEWGVVIGKEGSQITRERAGEHIFGYTIFNDWSARDEQFKVMGGAVSLGPGVGKDFANSLGPCIVTADEIPNPYALSMKAFVNGELTSDGNTSGMHFRFEELIEYLTRGHSLYPGEVLGSGTVGNGCSLETRRPISPGDTIELHVESIGVLRNRVVAPHIAPAAAGGFDGVLTKMLQLAIK